MRAYTRRRLLASLKLGVAAVPIWVVLALGHGRPFGPGTVMVPLGMGLSLGIAELFFLRNWLKGVSFLSHLAAKSVAFVAVMYVAFAILNVLDVLIDGITWQEYARVLTSGDVLLGMIEGLGLIVFLLFFVHLDRLLGPGVLLGYMTGRYHRPREESRVFMFLDLKGSTDLADEMEASRYFGFLRQYFMEMSEPILETDAEIYQYVGDEIVLSWTMKSGLEEASCVRVFFLIEEQMRAQRERFLADYGAVPDFKAGVHAGTVITAQIGEIKSEIVYNGDILNTTARIQATCNDLDRRLLVSASLMERLTLGPEYAVEDMGAVSLRGKGEPVSLYSVTRADEVVPAALTR